MFGGGLWVDYGVIWTDLGSIWIDLPYFIGLFGEVALWVVHIIVSSYHYLILSYLILHVMVSSHLITLSCCRIIILHHYCIISLSYYRIMLSSSYRTIA